MKKIVRRKCERQNSSLKYFITEQIKPHFKPLFLDNIFKKNSWMDIIWTAVLLSRYAASLVTLSVGLNMLYLLYDRPKFHDRKAAKCHWYNKSLKYRHILIVLSLRSPHQVFEPKEVLTIKITILPQNDFRKSSPVWQCMRFAFCSHHSS